TEEQLHGHYISPADLRASPGFEQLLDEARIIQMRDREKGMQQLSPTQKKAEEVSTRLVLFDKLCQNNPPSRPRTHQHEDPFHIVALDKVPGGGWFSLGDIKAMRNNRAKWTEVMQDRLARTPQLYIKPEYQDDLRRFQQHLKS